MTKCSCFVKNAPVRLCKIRQITSYYDVFTTVTVLVYAAYTNNPLRNL